MRGVRPSRHHEPGNAAAHRRAVAGYPCGRGPMPPGWWCAIVSEAQVVGVVPCRSGAGSVAPLSVTAAVQRAERLRRGMRAPSSSGDRGRSLFGRPLRVPGLSISSIGIPRSAVGTSLAAPLRFRCRRVIGVRRYRAWRRCAGGSDPNLKYSRRVCLVARQQGVARLTLSPPPPPAFSSPRPAPSRAPPKRHNGRGHGG